MTEHNSTADENPENIEQRSEPSTTTDLQQQAAEALKLFATLQDNTASQVKRKTGVFSVKMFLRVDVNGSHSSLYLRPKPEIVVGRRDPGGDYVPELDLSPYGAYQMGVSRRHAIIRWQGDHLYLYDLDSRNGSYVNGKKADPNQPVKLHDGDELRIGKLSLRIYFNENSG